MTAGASPPQNFDCGGDRPRRPREVGAYVSHYTDSRACSDESSETEHSVHGMEASWKLKPVLQHVPCRISRILPGRTSRQTSHAVGVFLPAQATHIVLNYVLENRQLLSFITYAYHSDMHHKPRLLNQLPDSLREPRQSYLDSPHHSLVSSSLSSSPLSSSTTPSRLFKKSFPP